MSPMKDAIFPLPNEDDKRTGTFLPAVLVIGAITVCASGVAYLAKLIFTFL